MHRLPFERLVNYYEGKCRIVPWKIKILHGGEKNFFGRIK